MAKKYNCKVTAAVEVATNMVTRITGEHNHDTDLAAKKVREKENEAIQEAARNPTVSPRTVLGNLAANVTATSPTSINHMRNQAAFKKAVQRERSKLVSNAAIPRCWEEMLSIPEALKVTASNENFLVCCDPLNPNGDELVVGYSSPTGLDILKNSSVFFGDGTFDIAECTLFKQLFIVVAKAAVGITVPCAYFFLPNKETDSYQKMWQVLLLLLFLFAKID